MKTFGKVCGAEITFMELSEEEVALIQKHREEKSRKGRKKEFMKAFNDLMTQITKEGFSLCISAIDSKHHEISKVTNSTDTEAWVINID